MLNRSIAPPFSKTFSFELPQPEIIPLKGGVPLVFLPGLQQEVFKLGVVFDAGKWWENKKGVSHFTAILLDKGTRNKSSNEIASLFDYYGAQIEISPGYDFVSVALYGLKKHFDKLFPLFLEIITEPSFTEDEFDLQKNIFVQNLKVNNEKNSYVASKLIRKNIFGADHPYGSSMEEDDANALTTEIVSTYFNGRFTAREIYLMGNFSDAEISSLSQHTFKSRSEETKSVSLQPLLKTETVNKDESVQSSIRLGKRTINRKHSDYFSLLILNHILGGFFGSRLMKNIREEKGLTYGIYSSITPFQNDCMFAIGADVGKEKKEMAISEIKLELNKLSQELIPGEELSVSKNHFLGSLQLEVANPFSVIEKIKNIRLNNLDDDYYKNLFESIQLSDSKNLKSIAEKHFSSSDLFEVSVG